MEKSIFPHFRMPAYELPTRCPYTFPVKLSNFGNSAFQNLEGIPQTNPQQLKQTLKNSQKRNNSEMCCQADFQEDFSKQLEKEVITEPTMKFIDIIDIDMPVLPSQTPNGYLKIPRSQNNFLQISEISLKTPIPIQKFITSTPEPEIPKLTEEEVRRMTAQARDPSAEMKQTQEYRLKAARERLEMLEDDAKRLEDDMKMQDQDFNRITAEYEAETGRNRKEIAIRLIEKMENNHKVEDEHADEEDRVAKILTNNQDLYSRIQRALTPKVHAEADEVPVREENLEAVNNERKKSKFNPIISKRISAAMNTAAQAINASHNILKPSVLKKPKK